MTGCRWLVVLPNENKVVCLIGVFFALLLLCVCWGSCFLRGSFISDRLEFERVQARFPGAVVSVMFWGLRANSETTKVLDEGPQYHSAMI